MSEELREAILALRVAAVRKILHRRGVSVEPQLIRSLAMKKGDAEIIKAYTRKTSFGWVRRLFRW